MSFDDSDDDAVIISDSPASIVTRIESELPDGPRFVAVKTATTTHAKEPHDIIKEVRLLASLSHPNIITLIKQELSKKSRNLSYWMPFIPYSLDEVLQCPSFSPHPVISFGNTLSPLPAPREIQFVVLAKSIIAQVLCGVNYLHSEHVQIAHRDIKPSNVLLSPSGRAQIIDFGIAFRVGEEAAAKAKDLWPESSARMYFEVSTGPYRAPELLFGARAYDPFAIDAWSLGVTFAEFFTPLRLEAEEDEDGGSFPFLRPDHPSESESGSESSAEPRAPTLPLLPFVISQGTSARPILTSRWTRTSLFDGTRGEIALAWSIFKLRGTPNPDSWPSFLTLPDASKVSFVDIHAADLGSFLPNLPPSASSMSSNTTTHSLSSNLVPSPLDLIHRFLVYEPSRRLHLSEALRHPWFGAEPGLVLPMDYDPADGTDFLGTRTEAAEIARTFTLEGQACTLGDLLMKHVANKGN